MRSSVKYAALAASALLWLGGPAPAADTTTKPDGLAQALACLEQPLIARLSGEWWQWALSIPADCNPVMDPVGTNAGVGQKGNIWFLAGTFGGGQPTVRNISVPGDQGLFFPLVNWVCWKWPTDPPWKAPYTDTSVTPPVTYPSLEAYFRAINKAGVDASTTSCEVDGKKVHGVRCASPGFNLWIPASMTWFGGPDNPVGVQGPAVAEGVYVLLPPLPPGKHTIKIKAGSGGVTFVNVTYNITVVKSEI